MQKLHLLYYKNLLDIGMIRFLDENNEKFTKENGRYILSDSIGKLSIMKDFKRYISDTLDHIIEKYDPIDPDYYFIIGSCLPKNNILLKYKDSHYFPKKLENFIISNDKIKYILKERDIVIGDSIFNDSFIEIFNDCFKSRKMVERTFGKKNLFFVQHRNLDCYSLFKIIKKTYGKTNCINVYKEMLSDIKIPIEAVNELILRYINNRKEILRRTEFSEISEEIKRYMDYCMETCIGD